jgi:hypothetical protein
MEHHAKRSLCAAPVFVAVALGAAACSQSSSSHDGTGTFDDTSGALVAHLKRIPEDVRCLEISTSDWRRSQVLVDVEPGTEATIRIAPLSPGYMSFWGAAYQVPCWEIWRDGGPWSNQTWVADYASVYVQSGHATPVTMTFRRLGSADVSVDFDDGAACDGGTVWGDAAAPCLPPPVSWDAGPR